MNPTIPFSAYMSASLYDKQNGYYVNPHRVGTKGDFYTSVSVSKFFGGSIASYILSLLENGDLSLPLHIAEVGADKGHLLGDIALFLDALGDNILQHCAFTTIEPLPPLAQIQKDYFSSLPCSAPLHFATFADFKSYPAPDEPTSLFVIANELFDSFPCEVINNGKILHIVQDSNMWRGIWQDIAQSNQSNLLHDILRHYIDSADIANFTQMSGIIPLWQDFITSLTHCARAYKHSYFLSFDYGDFAPATLKTNPRFYKSHQVENLESFLAQEGNFHTLYQQADITYDVDFILLDRLLHQAGFISVFCTSQAQALIEQMRILELLESFSTQKGFSAYFREIHKIKTLLHTMGERFKSVCYKM